MLWAHPVIQAAATIAALYMLWLGFNRFRMLHLKHKTKFIWKRHVRLGQTVLVIWILGMIGGMIMVDASWPNAEMPGGHEALAGVMVAFIIWVLGSGLFMNHRRAKRTRLPLAHGAAAATMVVISLVQVYSGVLIVKTFILGVF